MGKSLRAAAIFASLALPAQASDCNHVHQIGSITAFNPQFGTIVIGALTADLDFAKHQICYRLIPNPDTTASIKPDHLCMNSGEGEKTIILKLKHGPSIPMKVKPEDVAEKYFHDVFKCTAL